MNAQTLMDQISSDLADVGKQIESHRFISMLDGSELPLPAMQSFIAHQYHLLMNIIRADANMIHRFGATPFREHFFEVLQEEMQAYVKLMRFAAKIGMDEAALEHFEVDADAFAYACFVAWLAENGTPGEIICALTVNFPVWGANCGRMSAALREHHGFTAEDTAFLDIFAETAGQDQAQAMALAAIDFDLSQQRPPERIQRSARLMQAYELKFWDVMADTAEA